MSDPALPPLIRWKTLLTIVPLSRVQITEMVKRGEFPQPVRLTTKRALAFQRDEVLDWLATRPRGLAPSPRVR